MIIPDDKLSEYLEDKLLVKPDYPEYLKYRLAIIKSRYEETLARQKVDRQESNKKVTRDYGLKR